MRRFSVLDKKRLATVGRFFAWTGLLALTAGEAPAVEPAVPENKSSVMLSFAPVVKKAAPAVVNVFATRRIKSRTPRLFNDKFFEEFFGRSFGRGFNNRERVQNSLGSGVIVSEDGVVVTNNHVIKGAEAFKVVLSDRREFSAELILADERTDLAVLKLATGGETFPALQYRNSDNVQVGDLVLAIGNPFGVGQTVTNGIVSALARTEVGVTDFQSFIQTDAPINPGNSGGALVTMDGRLLGVNTAIYSRSGGSVGIGFAIPSKMVQQVVRAALSDGKITRPWIGAELQKVSQSLADTLGLARPQGALIVALHSDSPLKKAGLKSGDVIIAVEDNDVAEPENLRYRLAVMEIGNKARLTYLRNGNKRTTAFTLVAAPEIPPREKTLLSGEHPLNGVTVGNINPAVAEELSLGMKAEGVVVLDVTRASRASRIGMRAGDILLSVNSKRTTQVSDIVRALQANVLEWNLEIRRGGRVIRTSLR